MTQEVKPLILLLALVLEPREKVPYKPLRMGEKELLISTHRNKRKGRDIWPETFQVLLEFDLGKYSTFLTLLNFLA